jgi:hypothetical protein
MAGKWWTLAVHQTWQTLAQMGNRQTNEQYQTKMKQFALPLLVVYARFVLELMKKRLPEPLTSP